ncbi:hypothetical protein FB451DRAFT_1176751 [Mycena latifolia]|nr:hypothetical protein FB451DRAFT_1176751 [Mycena latifolia]
MASIRVIYERGLIAPEVVQARSGAPEKRLGTGWAGIGQRVEISRWRAIRETKIDAVILSPFLAFRRIIAILDQPPRSVFESSRRNRPREFVQCQQLGTEERALNTTIGRLADPENVRAEREEKEEDPERASLPPAPAPGEMRHKRGWQREREWGQFTARGEQTRRRDVLLAHRAAHIRAEVAPQPAPRHAVHYVDAQSPTRHAVRACISTRAHSMMRCAVAPGRRRRVRGKEGPEMDSRRLLLPRTMAGTKLPTPRTPRATTRARGAQPGGMRRHAEALERHPVRRDDTRKRGGAGREGKERREAAGQADASYIETRAQCRDGYAAQKREHGALDAKLRGNETHLPGPAIEVPIDWGCHVTDARRGTPSASAGREGTDGALAEWTAGENESTTKKTRLNSSICNSCSRGSLIRARLRASAGEEETGAARKTKRTVSGSARTVSRGGQLCTARVTLGGRNDADERMHGTQERLRRLSSSAADASAGNDEDGGGDGCDDDEGGG